MKMKFKEWIEQQWFYHVTIDPEGILKNGFLTAEQLGGSSDILGGSIRNAVSFTTKENAENYFQGLKIWKNAAQGRYNFQDLGINTNWLVELEKKYPVSARRTWAITNKTRHGAPNEELMFNFLQNIALESKSKFPLIMGSRFPDRLKNAKSVAILKISSLGPQNIKWFPGEQEWKVFDPERLNLNTLEVVKNEF